MSTFVYMTRCDGCGMCVDICPSDIMHIDKTSKTCCEYRAQYVLGMLFVREGLVIKMLLMLEVMQTSRH